MKHATTICNSVTTLWNQLKMKKYYGIWLLVLAESLFILILLLWGDRLIIAPNDCLDSNISLYKMFKDIGAWTNRSEPIPMLGGVDRSILSCGYDLGYILYWIFDTQIAFWLNYVVALALSGTGFYFFGNSIRKLTGRAIDPNIFCICGIIYIFCGMWPIAILQFSLIPWWAFLTIEIYRTNRYWYALFYIILGYQISGPLLGVFLIFYTLVFCLVVSIRDKRISKSIVTICVAVVVQLIINERRTLLMMLHGSEGTVKALASKDGIVYSDTLSICTHKLIDTFLLNSVSVYHSGVYTLRYIALPLVLFFFLLFNIKRNIKRKVMQVDKDFLIVYDILVGAIFINACGQAFDNYYLFRRLVPFLSGFSFARFMWLSPFMIMLCVIMVLHYLIGKRCQILVGIIVIAIPVSIVLDVDYSSYTSMYNILHDNFYENILLKDVYLPVKWNEYYAEDLFEEIKREIDYDGEWSVAYGLEPAVLQYNTIKTLDGYYSNYSTDYKERWEQMIMPVLQANDDAMEYWRSSNGQRAYVYSEEWIFPDLQYDYAGMGEVDMLINPDILRELGGKYVFSRVKIKNADDLGFEYINTWSDDRGIYDISVYRIQ